MVRNARNTSSKGLLTCLEIIFSSESYVCLLFNSFGVAMHMGLTDCKIKSSDDLGRFSGISAVWAEVEKSVILRNSASLSNVVVKTAKTSSLDFCT